MMIEGPAKWLRIYIGEADRLHGKPLYQVLVEYLRAEGIAGATVFRAIEGYGAHSHVHTARVLRLSEDLPLVIDVIDRSDKIEAVLPDLDRMVDGGLIVSLDVNVVTYRAQAAS
jgi:PII-like signaling protein